MDSKVCFGSEPRRFHPEARLPSSAWRNRVEFLVQPLVCEVHGVGDTSHRFECDEIRIALATLCGPPRGGRIRRPDYDRTPVAIEHDLELLASSLHDHLREATSVAHEVAKDI